MNELPDQAPPPSGDGRPRFGRLLIALLLAVLLIGALALSAEAYYA